MSTGNDVRVERLPLTPAMRASLTFYQSWLPVTLILSFASVGACMLITVKPTELRWELGALITGAIAVGIVAWSRHAHTSMVLPLQQDMRNGVYCRAIGSVVVEEETPGEDLINTLLVGDHRFHGGWRFDRLRAGLGATATESPTRWTKRFTAHAIVSYLPCSGQLLEVRNEAGDLLYQADILRLVSDRAGRTDGPG